MDNKFLKCFSSYFINKQFIRSYSSIIKYSLFKNDIDCFVKYIFGEKDLIDIKNSNNFVEMLYTLRNNARRISQDDFKSYFITEDDQYGLKPISKDKIICSCLKALHDLIPKEYIGNNHNLKIFKLIVYHIVYSMKGEHINIYKLLNNWMFNASPWTSFSYDLQRKLLNYLLDWIIQDLLAAMIALNFHVTTCKLDGDERKLYFFKKNEWQRFYDKSISKLLVTKVIIRKQENSFGKVIRKRYNEAEYKKIKNVIKKIPKLHLILKRNNEFRPIVQYRQDISNRFAKNKIKERQIFLRKLLGKSDDKIEKRFVDLYNLWVHNNKPKLYFVKTDLSNAFGSVNRQLLIKVICQNYSELIKQENDLNVKKKLAQQYKDLISELRKPLLVRCGSTVYEWREGLVQGYKYSPALSEIYYNYLDKVYFSELIENLQGIKFFIRVVDDYLFVTNSVNGAEMFLNTLSNFRNVNNSKTVVNFMHPTIAFSSQITFIGYSYNTSNLQVSRAENVYIGQICYKIAFSNALANLSRFLESRIGQSGIPISGHMFNFIYNNEELIWNHVFTTLCLSANKFCTILAVFCHELDMGTYLNLYKKRVAVKLCNTIIKTLLRNKPDNFDFFYCINHFRYLSFKALKLCAKHTPKCNHLVPNIQQYLSKTDCIFGKWKEHASRIDVNGICQQKAVKDICRKVEYKDIVKNFTTLPKGFQCYNRHSRT